MQITFDFIYIDDVLDRMEKFNSILAGQEICAIEVISSSEVLCIKKEKKIKFTPLQQTLKNFDTCMRQKQLIINSF